MKIFIGSDHAGFELKKVLVEYLHGLGHDVRDLGAKQYTPDDDYPDFIFPVAESVAKEKNTVGIVIGGSGQGEAIASNKIKGIRAIVYYGGNLDIIKLSREHNDANVLSLGARFIPPDEARRAVNLWLDTAFSFEERHARRIRKIKWK
jgi:ribose 5-phosphate isomerase B